jgi:hypothetical protein
MLSQTVDFHIIFAWQENPSPIKCPDSGMVSEPVWTEILDFESIIATCLTSGFGSNESLLRKASSGIAPLSISSIPSGPCSINAIAWVATAPIPALAQQTIPAANQWDWTATPIWPVSGHLATME